MTRPGIEPRSPGPLANTLTAGPWHVQTNDWCLIELLMIYWNTWNYLTVYKEKWAQAFKNVINKMCLQILYLIYRYKEGLALNNLQWLICHKTQSPELLFFFYQRVKVFPLHGLSFWLSLVEKHMFSPFVRIFLIRTCFSIHITQ